MSQLNVLSEIDMMVNVSHVDESTTENAMFTDMIVAAAAAADATSNICIIEQNN